MTTEQLIEAILFFKNEPISVRKLSSLLSKSEDDIRNGLDTLDTSLSGRGIRLMRNDDEVVLATAPEVSELIASITKEELTRDLGKAGLEVLTLVVYKGPISRREIDYIRGVNSSFILRNLLIRGLIEKTENKEGERSFTYKPTFELLSYLGIQRVSDMPEYEDIQRTVEDAITAIQSKEEPSDTHGTH